MECLRIDGFFCTAIPLHSIQIILFPFSSSPLHLSLLAFPPLLISIFRPPTFGSAWMKVTFSSSELRQLNQITGSCIIPYDSTQSRLMFTLSYLFSTLSYFHYYLILWFNRINNLDYWTPRLRAARFFVWPHGRYGTFLVMTAVLFSSVVLFSSMSYGIWSFRKYKNWKNWLRIGEFNSIWMY